MFIERVQIEEGFLDGLDLRFCEGLNTIIGERGTGKTSLVELIRFCLDIRGYSSDVAKRSRDHALSVLGSGQITVTLTDGQRRIVVSRTANDTQPRASGPFRSPIVFSQTEIESVGLQPTSRLQLIDIFAPRNNFVVASMLRAGKAMTGYRCYLLDEEISDFRAASFSRPTAMLRPLPLRGLSLGNISLAASRFGKGTAISTAKIARPKFRARRAAVAETALWQLKTRAKAACLSTSLLWMTTPGCGQFFATCWKTLAKE